uniref:Uncharacterized protein n=1 Tax=Arundo donax TaxID=35708 RepID=A0A0A9DNW0_ARUDO
MTCVSSSLSRQKNLAKNSTCEGEHLFDVC